METVLQIVLFAMPFVMQVANGRFDGARTLKSDAPGEAVAWHYPREEYDSFYYNAVVEDRYQRPNGHWSTPFREKVLADSTKYTRYDLWYAGSNYFYPPHRQLGSLFGRYRGADYWHQMKDYQTWTISLTALFAGLSVWRSGLHWYHFTYLGLHGVEGISFEYHYKFSLRKPEYREDGSRWMFCKRQLNKLPLVDFKLDNKETKRD